MISIRFINTFISVIITFKKKKKKKKNYCTLWLSILYLLKLLFFFLVDNMYYSYNFTIFSHDAVCNELGLVQEMFFSHEL